MPGNAKILEGVIVYVIDDDEAVRDSLAAVLETHGATIIALRGAREARNTSVNDHRSVLLIDVNLGDGKGPDLLAELRRKGVKAAAILMTGKIDSRVQAVASHLQVLLVEKPVDGDDVALRMAAMMGPGHG